MPETTSYITDDERLLASARAWGETFPQVADLMARIEARWLCVCSQPRVAGECEVVRFDKIWLRLRDGSNGYRELSCVRWVLPLSCSPA